MYYVYELINLQGTVEYVGQSKRPKVRFLQHTKYNPGTSLHGRFLGRQDLILNVVSCYETKAEVLQAEYELQKFWGLPCDKEKAVGLSVNAGSKNTWAKLNEDQVKEIKRLISQNYKLTEIAKKFKVTHGSIGNIKSGKTWSHVEWDIL